MKRHGRVAVPVELPSAFSGFRFPPEVIMLAVRWYLRFGLSYRDLESLLAERGVEVDHVTLHRWVQRFTSVLRSKEMSASVTSTRPQPSAGNTVERTRDR